MVIKLIKKYLHETWNRLFTSTPSYFRVIKNLGAILAMLAGIPMGISKIALEYHVSLPGWFETFSSKSTFVGAVVAFIVSKLVVKNPDTIKVKDSTIKPLLPFTKSNLITNKTNTMDIQNLEPKELGQLFDWGVILGKEISDDLADKKITLQEGLGLLDNFMQVPDLLSKKDLILEQAKALTLDQVDIIVTKYESTFTKEEVIETIHDSLNWIVATKNLIVRFGKKKTNGQV